nr:MAG TPA: hypothetical protein [Caudoviricetes sp.]
MLLGPFWVRSGSVLGFVADGPGYAGTGWVGTAPRLKPGYRCSFLGA